MSWIKFNFIFFVSVSSFFSSCAPVKFTKSDNFQVVPVCPQDSGCGLGGPAIACSPKINSTNLTFTYVAGGALPSISSNCNPLKNDYLWTVKRADASVITPEIPGLSGANPQAVNFNGLGPGAYYVYLTASQTGSTFSPYVATTPLEFIVSGGEVGNQLTCDPKLNKNFTTVNLNASDKNAEVSANCSPAAGMYTWSVTRNGVPLVVAGLSGGVSTPDIKSYGVGTYQISLYATVLTSQHWQSSNPLTVTVSDTGPVTPPLVCNPRINGNMTSFTINSTSANPLISANCLPTNVQYNWSVTKNGNPVTVPGLAGANSNPNFLSLGTGTYLVSLMARGNNLAPWNTTTPLVLTVDPLGGGLTLNCSPRLNLSAVVLTVPNSGTNPNLTSNCNPDSATTTWTVIKNGVSVTVPGLSGANSNPDFISSGLGTYLIYLTASAPGYSAYASPSPLEVTISSVPSPVRTINFQKLVQPSDNKVDILVIIDDSNSMLPESTKLAQKMQGFVSNLTAAGLDWQMCATITNAQLANGTMYWGLSRNWVNYLGSPQWILKMGAADPYAIFTDTVNSIGAGWADTEDERGIKAAWWSTEYRMYNNCYRDDASLAVISISNEDERSVGGDPGQQYYPTELYPLEGDDQPFGYINKIKQTFGINKRFVVNSIIVKPGDAACMASQDSSGTKSHYGFKHQELSQLTGGHIASICDTDYSNNLYYFKDRIINTLASVPLECAPPGPITVSITPPMGTVNTLLTNNNLVFSPAIPVGRTVNISYDCPQN